jgi:1-deoxy-D-xylulose-5-phosphate reductoisomerase
VAVERRSVTVLGSTGSIGTSTVDLLLSNPERFQVRALAGGRNVKLLAEQARSLRAELAVIADPGCLPELEALLAGSGIASAAGTASVVAAAALPADWTMAAITGAAGLPSTLAAIERGGAVALANKEALVCAGDVMLRAVSGAGATLLPVDSEHNAIFQCLHGEDLADVRWITLTASGGPLRTWTAEQIAGATPAQAVAHPNWSMGAKISVDSATMMNKGLEVIEAHHLFPVGLDKIRIVVHPQSVIHSLVEYRDGSTLAQLGPSDMRVPIASCLAWPQRMKTELQPLDLPTIGTLSFFAPDEVLFPATRLAREAAEAGGAAPAVLNAANEVAVAAFLAGQIAFTDICALVAQALDQGNLPPAPLDLAEVLDLDRATRRRAAAMLERI